VLCGDGLRCAASQIAWQTEVLQTPLQVPVAVSEDSSVSFSARTMRDDLDTSYICIWASSSKNLYDAYDTTPS
jgi:hypothetical protein